MGQEKISKSILYDTAKEEIINLKKSPFTKVFVNVARVSKQKNQELLIKVFDKLLNESKDVILLAIGRQTDLSYLKKIQDKIPKNVYLLGSKSNATDYMLLADAFCLSSLWEGMPISFN